VYGFGACRGRDRPNGRWKGLVAIDKRSSERRPIPPPRRPPASRFDIGWRVVGVALLVAVLLTGIRLGSVPGWLGIWYLAAGLMSLAVYGFDKQAAIAGAWRVAEVNLHYLDLAGGIVGGLMGQVAFHHKVAKPDFSLGTAAIAGMHVMGLGAALVYSSGAFR
jgi:uncharacterized membrane protein YsdA (DUF1294 family)